MALGLLLMTAAIGMLVRNERVYRYRIAMIDRLLVPSDPKFDSKRKYFHSVSRNEMLWQFWRPINSFYKSED